MTVTLDLSAIATDAQTRRVFSELSLAVAKKKRIVVVTGAGISCSCGIPDFRSSGGLYNMVKERYPDVVMKGRDLFDASLFRDSTSTSVFYSFIAELKKKIDEATPSPTHHFIKTLDTKSRLLRSYTQNIDGLEEKVGLLGSSAEAAQPILKGKGKARCKQVRNVQLHGDIQRVRCMACSASYLCTEEHLNTFLEGTAPDCPECVSRSQARAARSARPLRVGSLRPGIVLYDEPHPLGEEIGTIQTSDIAKKPDMLIIMGTSLKVHGLKKLVKDFAKTIRSNATASSSSAAGRRPFQVIFVNKTPPGSEWSDVIDYHVAGDTDSWTTKVIDDWKRMRPADWEIQQTLIATVDATDTGAGLKLVKTTALANGKKVLKKRDENIAPEDQSAEPAKVISQKTIIIPPLSPSKRRQKSSHYDDVNSSPSKRQSVAPFRGALSSGERKLLFTETTNNVPSPEIDAAETSKMDISLVDLSMQDLQLEVLQDISKSVKSVPKAVKSKTIASRSRSRTVTSKPSARRRTKAQLDPTCTS